MHIARGDCDPCQGPQEGKMCIPPWPWRNEECCFNEDIGRKNSCRRSFACGSAGGVWRLLFTDTRRMRMATRQGNRQRSSNRKPIVYPPLDMAKQGVLCLQKSQTHAFRRCLLASLPLLAIRKACPSVLTGNICEERQGKSERGRGRGRRRGKGRLQKAQQYHCLVNCKE
jgi:hypothetical protein